MSMVGSMVVNHLLDPGMILQVVVLVKIIYNQLAASAKFPLKFFGWKDLGQTSLLVKVYSMDQPSLSLRQSP